MAYSRHQRQNIGIALGMTRKDPARIRRALLEAMAVESNFRHVNYGDRDSLGVLQQRPSMGWGRYMKGARGVRQDISDFLVRARKTNRSFRGSAGQLAQSVQRSAFPERYDERAGEVNRLISKFKEFSGGSPARANFQPTGFGGGGGVSRNALLSFVMANNASFASGEFNPIGAGFSLVAALKSMRQGSDLGAKNPTAPNVTLRGKAPRSRAQAMVQVMRKASNMGLSVRENPMYDHVDPVHVSGSDHYKRFRKNLGRAADISGDPRKEKVFANWVARKYGHLLKDMFHDPLGWSYDEGRKIGRNLAPGHSHVHVSF